ncbi:MAG: carboxypeptidase regulatory-like domain-containing protein [Euryarchaeota archaeon]|nr:carboxypeptidase regulatory-like domain-containing protein [Euryarchaeota archaeon]
MLGPQAILSTVMVAFVALAGCASSSSGTPAEASVAPASPPQYDDSTGAVVGVVTDDEAVPVAGAEVGIAGEGHTQTTTTDAMGAFTLSRIPPGGYQLFAQRLGFESTARPTAPGASFRPPSSPAWSARAAISPSWGTSRRSRRTSTTTAAPSCTTSAPASSRCSTTLRGRRGASPPGTS